TRTYTMLDHCHVARPVMDVLRSSALAAGAHRHRLQSARQFRPCSSAGDRASGVPALQVNARISMSDTQCVDRRALLKLFTGLGIGAAATLGTETSASAADRTAEEQANVQVVSDFCRSW